MQFSEVVLIRHNHLNRSVLYFETKPNTSIGMQITAKRKSYPNLTESKSNTIMPFTCCKLVQSDEGVFYPIHEFMKIILPPFMGSGSTVIASIELKRKFVGFKIQTHYFEICQKRFENLYAERAKRVYHSYCR